MYKCLSTNDALGCFEQLVNTLINTLYKYRPPLGGHLKESFLVHCRCDSVFSVQTHSQLVNINGVSHEYSSEMVFREGKSESNQIQ